MRLTERTKRSRKNVINIVLSRFKNKHRFILATIQIGLSQLNTIFFSDDGKQKQQYCLFVFWRCVFFVDYIVIYWWPLFLCECELYRCWLFYLPYMWIVCIFCSLGFRISSLLLQWMIEYGYRLNGGKYYTGLCEWRQQYKHTHTNVQQFFFLLSVYLGIKEEGRSQTDNEEAHIFQQWCKQVILLLNADDRYVLFYRYRPYKIVTNNKLWRPMGRISFSHSISSRVFVWWYFLWVMFKFILPTSSQTQSYQVIFMLCFFSLLWCASLGDCCHEHRFSVRVSKIDGFFSYSADETKIPLSA